MNAESPRRMCEVCTVLRPTKRLACQGVCKAILGYEGGYDGMDPCILCLNNTPTRYWHCQKACTKKVAYVAELAEHSVNKAATESANRLKHKQF